MAIVKSVTKFNQASEFPEDQIAQVVRSINAGHIPDTKGERYYKFMGWRIDIGNKPYLIESADGHICRRWGQCIGALRRSLYLSRSDRLVADPFVKGGS